MVCAHPVTDENGRYLQSSHGCDMTFADIDATLWERLDRTVTMDEVRQGGDMPYQIEIEEE